MKPYGAKSESQKVEYKRAWRDEYLGWVCGFANAKGGTLYIGIDDDKRVCGVADADRLMEDIPNKIRTNVGIVADVSLVKRSGRPGFRKILDAYSNEASNTKKLKPEFYSTEQSFVVSLPNLNCGKSVAVTQGGTVNGTVNDGVRSLAELISENPGLRANALAKLEKKSLRTVKRNLGELAAAGKIEFRGAPKTGGYYLRMREEK